MPNTMNPNHGKNPIKTHPSDTKRESSLKESDKNRKTPGTDNLDKKPGTGSQDKRFDRDDTHSRR